MLGRIGLLSRFAVCKSKTIAPISTRKLYTDTIYPYPFKYVNSLSPGEMEYRETYKFNDWDYYSQKSGHFGMVMFWTYIWYMTFSYPDVLSGHWHFPDPKDFTDEELGIPPDEEGPYADWLQRKLETQQN